MAASTDKLCVSFTAADTQALQAEFEKKRSELPMLPFKEYFGKPDAVLEPHLKRDPHVVEFRVQPSPKAPVSVWHFVKTAEVAANVLRAPRYGDKASGHPWGPGLHTQLLRDSLAVDDSEGAGTNNVVGATAKTHKELRGPLASELKGKALEAHLPKLADYIQKALASRGSKLDLLEFSGDIVPNSVLALMGLPRETITIADVLEFGELGKKVAQRVPGANEEMVAKRLGIDKKVQAVMDGRDGLLKSLAEAGYSDVACRETAMALMFGAGNGTTAMTHFLWLLTHDKELQDAATLELKEQAAKAKSWPDLLDSLKTLRKIFHYSLVRHSPARVILRNAINPRELTVKDSEGEHRYAILPGDRLYFLVSNCAKQIMAEKKPNPLTDRRISLAHLPFSAPPHRCPASIFIEKLAVMAASLLLSQNQLLCELDHLTIVANPFANEIKGEVMATLKPREEAIVIA